MNSIQSWLGTSSSIFGGVLSSGVLAGLLTGQMTWQQALPALVGGVVSIAWPQNTAAPTVAKSAVTDFEALIAAFQGAKSTPATPVATPAVAATPSLDTLAQAVATHVVAKLAPAAPHGMGAP